MFSDLHMHFYITTESHSLSNFKAAIFVKGLQNSVPTRLVNSKLSLPQFQPQWSANSSWIEDVDLASWAYDKTSVVANRIYMAKLQNHAVILQMLYKKFSAGCNMLEETARMELWWCMDNVWALVKMSHLKQSNGKPNRTAILQHDSQLHRFGALSIMQAVFTIQYSTANHPTTVKWKFRQSNEISE